MKFIRLTSVFLCCALLSSFLILPASAVDDNDYYSLSPVGSSVPSLAMDWPVSPVAGGEYNSALSQIQTNQLTQTNVLQAIQSALQSVNVWLGKIEGNTSRIKDYSSILSAISNKVATESTLSALSDKVATETTLSAFFKSFSGFYDVWQWLYDKPTWEVAINSDGSSVFTNYKTYLGNAIRELSYDTLLYYPERLTLRGMVRRLQETLASDDDVELAKNQKENREQIENDFLSGKSGKTSLGKDDFGSLSSVGGTFKDTISLNGQSSLSDLTSGLADADTAGQGWFSQATKDSLDAVSGSGSSESTVSTFSDDGLSSVDIDPDPYHMQGFEDNYAWLWGDD